MRQLRTVGFTLVELMIVVAIVGILAAIAIPNFIKFQAKSKQSEAKQTLKGFFVSQRDYFGEYDTYADDFGALGFAPERGNRYAYKSLATPTQWQLRNASTLGVFTKYEAIGVDCFKIGGTCTDTPARNTPASFVLSYDNGAVGPSDTGVTLGSNGGFVIEAIGTIDNDDAMDNWIVASGSITVTGNACAEADNGPAGVMVQLYNDIMCP